MPKRKKHHRGRSEQRAEAKAAAQEAANKQTKKKNSGLKHKGKKTQGTTQLPTESKTPDLGSRFAALPPELRAEIFAWLLVRPVKWDAPHLPACPLNEKPFRDIRPRLLLATETCATFSRSVGRWRARTKPIHVNPWRSTWAPPIRNEFLCSECWDMRFRSSDQREPMVKSLPCLCARSRRQDGLSALLVCKSWYEEGARVLYSRNTFAFANVYEAAFFFDFLKPQWAALVSKVSLLANTRERVYPETSSQELQYFEAGRGFVTRLEYVWKQLSKLPALSRLELDALFLTSLDCVRVFRGASLRNLRAVAFTQSYAAPAADVPKGYVWPQKACRVAVEDSQFVEDVARGIKGLRCGWVRGQDRGDKQTTESEKERFRTRLGQFTISPQGYESLKKQEAGVLTPVVVQTIFRPV
ncbi:hypothetical protein GGR57DRAFT_154758 [Xylariaceae sp. FL1272]|nr:hypothetical protein GGR57DRAFT_154758 [Xylariaceae sp. FL1272]